MSTTFYVPALNGPEVYHDAKTKGDVVTYRFDARGWEAANGTLTTATWTVREGNASVAGQALSSGVASANVTLSEEGRSLIKIALTDGTRTHTIHLDIRALDPDIPAEDYGLTR